MGTMQHHAVIVTGWEDEAVKAAHDKAVEVYAAANDAALDGDGSSLVGPVVAGLTNGYSSFSIHPDGSKEWWPTSDAFDKAREEFIGWIRSSGRYLDWVVVEFGELGTKATAEGDAE